MRKKTQPPVAIADVKNAWDSVFQESRIEDYNSLLEDGWLTVELASVQMNLSYSATTKKLTDLCKVGKMETILAKVRNDGVLRKTRFFRPKV